MEAIPENIGRGFEAGEVVKIMRSSGEMEDGWKLVLDVSPDADPETRVLVISPDGKNSKNPTLAKLREWNS